MSLRKISTPCGGVSLCRDGAWWLFGSVNPGRTLISLISGFTIFFFIIIIFSPEEEERVYRQVEKFQEGYDVGLTTAAYSTPECYLESEVITKAKPETTIVLLTWVSVCLELLSTAFTGMGGCWMGGGGGVGWGGCVLLAWFFYFLSLNIRAAFPKRCGEFAAPDGAGTIQLSLPGRYILWYGRGWGDPKKTRILPTYKEQQLSVPAFGKLGRPQGWLPQACPDRH